MLQHSSTRNQSRHHGFKISIITPTFVDGERWVDFVLTMYRKQRIVSALSWSPSSRSLEFLAIKLLVTWRFLTSAHPPSLHSLVSSIDGMVCSNQPGCGENNNRPQYVRVACTSLGEKYSVAIILPQYAPATSSALTKRSPQSNALTFPKTGRRRDNL